MLIDDSGRVMSFAEFKDQAERVAAGLHQMGVTQGSPVTWMLPTRIETVVLSFALSRLGAVQNPIVHVYRRSEVEFCIRQTQAQLAIHPGMWGGFDYGAMFNEIINESEQRFEHAITILDGYENLPEADPATLPQQPDIESAIEPDAVRWLYYNFGTSGVSAEPKGVKHTDSSLLAGGLAMMRALAVGVDDVGSIAFPFAHIRGPCYITMMLAAGVPTLLIESFDPGDAMLVYARHGVTMAGGSAAFYRMFLAEDRRSRETVGSPAMPALRLLAGSGAAIAPKLYFQVKEQMGVPVAHGYGMHECPIIAQGSPHDSDDRLAHSAGRVVQDCRVAIVAVGADGGEVRAPAGIQGEVRVSGAMLFSGYTDPALDADAFDSRGRFRTGVLGVLTEDGYLILTGKAADILATEGEEWAAAEIEPIVSAYQDAAMK